MCICVCTYYVHERPMNFHRSLQMSFVLQYALYCISMRKPDSAGCLIGWFQFHGAHDLIKTFVTVGYKTILVEFTLQLKIIIGMVTKPLKSSVNAFNVFFFLVLCRGSLATATWLPRMQPTKAEAKVTWEAKELRISAWRTTNRYIKCSQLIKVIKSLRSVRI